MKFIIDNGGDYSVGIKGFRIEITIEDKDEILESHEDFITRMKEFLKEEFEDEDGKTYIYTEEELQNLIDYEVEKLDRLNEGE